MQLISDPYSGKQNFLLITLDSCRWDTFIEANTSKLFNNGCFYKSYTQATYTFPSHLSMFSGIFPHVNSRIPFFNRFERNLFWLIEEKKDINPYLALTPGCLNIQSGLRSIGYSCFGTGAVEWFRSSLLTDSFDEFYFAGIDASNQLDWIINKIRSIDNRFFVFINFGETHDPYEHGGLIKPSLKSRQRMRAFVDDGYLYEDREKQIKSIEYIDKLLGTFFTELKKISRHTIVIICGDHGECFGEDGLYGHGFYHEKVMEVPLGIFEIINE